MVTTQSIAEPPVITPARPSATPRSGIPPLQLRVLVADDNRDAADILGGLFMLAGAEVRVAYDGPSAAAIAVEFHPDAGVFDVNMPRMDGWELARRVRAATGGRPLLLIAVSGAGRPDAARQAAVAGFNLHLTKPADPRELVATLSEFDLWLRAGADDHR